MNSPGLGLHDRALRVLLVLVLVLQGFTWWRQVGYSEADAVEFVSRAQAWVESVDLGQPRLRPRMRPFGFSALFVPLFATARVLELDDLRPVLALARCMQIGLALALLVVTARIAAELGGRRAGLAAAFLLGVNPLFLHYSVTPVSGIAAALCVALGLQRALARDGFRAGLASGLWLAAGVLVAYQALMVALILGALLGVRHRWSGRATWGGYCAGLSVCLPAGLVVDRIAYGGWGVSLLPYLASNFGFIAVRFLVDLGLRDLGTQLYTVLARLVGGEFDPDITAGPVGQLQGRAWYLTTLPNVLVWPAAALGALGLATLTLRAHRRAVWLLALLLCVLGAAALGHAPARPLLVVPVVAAAFVWARVLAVRPAPDWKAALLGLLLALALLVMSSKGNKLYRLWLPVLPIAVVLCAWGFALLAGRSRVRLAAALCVLLCALPLGFVALGRLPLRHFSSYWRAVEWINAAVEAEGPRAEQDEPRLAAAFEWAVYLRASDAIGTARMPTMIDAWDELDPAQQAELTSALDGLDWLVLHEPVVRMHPGLLAVLNERMHVRAAFFEPEGGAELGPVFVLSRRDGEGGAGRFSFFELSHGPALPVRAPLADSRAPVYFRNREVPEQAFEGATLLALEHETLPGDGFGWLTWHWRADSEFQRDYRVLGRITGPGGVHLWHNPHEPASGVWPTSKWQPGWILKESYLVVPRVEARAALAERGVASDGEEVPGELWVSLNVQPDKRRTTARMEVFRAGEQVPVAAQLAPGVYESTEGFVFSKDGMTRVGGVGVGLGRATSVER